MPMRFEVTEESLIEHVKVKLGWPTTCVELSEEALKDSALDAALWMAVHLGQERRTTISVAAGTSEYTLPNDCETVIDVAFPQAFGGSLPLALELEGAEDLYYAQFYRFGANAGGFASNIYQHLQYIDMTKRVLSADTEHAWQHYQQKLVVQPDTLTGTAIVWYLSNQIDFDRLTLAQKHLMRRYAVASAMMVLGLIRSKFSEVPAAGGRVTLNGDNLISSAENEMMNLNEKIGMLVPPAGFITG